MKKSNKLFFLCALCFGMIVGTLYNNQDKPNVVYADNPTPLTDTQLHSLTKASYFRNETPAITIFMHGLGCKAFAWSNDYNGSSSYVNFRSDSESILEKMRASSTNGINLYRIDDWGVYSEYSSSGTSYSNAAPMTCIDFSKHVVLVPELSMSESMEEIYKTYDHIIDSVIYSYKTTFNKIPCINLVGHSMGGLLNMQYAIEHPKNVASLVSLGTPYNGSWYDNPLVSSVVGIPDFNNQPCICGTCPHDYYFCNLETRKNRWNSVYSTNTHIKFYALCGEITSDLWHEIVFGGDLDFYYPGAGSKAGGIVIDVLSFRGPCILPGDVCVNSDSQKAVGYNGVINYTKEFTPSNSNLSKRCKANIAIPHNLETYDSDMHTCVLGIIDYGASSSGNEYEENGIEVSILAKKDTKYFVKIRNNTSIATSFEYNSKLCTGDDAKKWTNLCDIKTTRVLQRGLSTVVEIEENVFATHLTISYNYGDERMIFYADNLNGSSLSMTSYSNIVNCPTKIKGNIELCILSKYSTAWSIKLTNRTNSARTFAYNERMCSVNDAKKWQNLYNVEITDYIAVGESTIIEIYEFGTATDIAICYDNNNGYRSIVYAHNLNTNRTFTCLNDGTQYDIESSYGLKAKIVGKNNNGWLIDIRNETGASRTFEYNTKMCNYGDAKNWTGLTDVKKTVDIPNNRSTIVEIIEYSFATSIAISYVVNDTTRYILYADNLSYSLCTMSGNSTYTSYNTYNLNNMVVSIVGKNMNIWRIRVVNKTAGAVNFYYNAKMCNYNDAKNWTGLTDIVRTNLVAKDDSVEFDIQQNGTATSIAISYINDYFRYYFYADNLKASGKMSAHWDVKALEYKEYYGIKVRLLGKSGNKWLIDLKNNTGNDYDFQYNYRMCFTDHAKNWTGLNDIRTIHLDNGQSNSAIQIQENGTATDIAISYKSGDHRYVFYAHNLSASCTMTYSGNDIDTSSSSSGNCITEGTLITLADGTQKPVEELTGEEMLLVWNFETGSYDAAPIMFVDSDPQGHYEVVKLTFSDNTEVDVVTEHGFFDKTLNKFVYLDENASDYIGHNFVKQAPNGYEEVALTDVTISTEVTRTYSPVTYGALCYYVNGMLSMPGGIEGMFNIFEVDSETMRYDAEAMQEDISTYGLLTYEELSQFLPVSEELFDGVNGQYLNVAIGKGLITLERLQELAERYGSFFDDEETTEVTYSDEYIKQYVVDAFSMSGTSLKAYIEAYIRHYTGNHWKHIPSSVYNNAIWEVSYDTEYFYATVSVRYRNTIFVFDIQVAQ